MTNDHQISIHMKKSAMTVVDALTKAGARVEGVDHPAMNSDGGGPAPGSAVHRVTWSALADTQVRAELRRLEQLGEVDIQTQD